ncbi:MAG TPA: hypothetical protein VFR21_22070 [Bradyrhizobium sp.]|nr:hypothetical protein [Bradyrhizobium sp.]
MSPLLKHSHPEPADACISATERRIADQNERIILDLMRGRDTAVEEEKVARDLVSLARMRRKPSPGRGRVPR